MIDIRFPDERMLVVWSESLQDFFIVEEGMEHDDDIPLTPLSCDFDLLREFKKALVIASQYVDVVSKFNRIKE